MSNMNHILQDLIDNNKILKDDNKIKVRNRLDTWKKQASLYSDDFLNKLKTAMLKVFCEESPEFSIDKKQRIYADSESKKTHYSNDIREGLAIELAIIGNYNNLLTNCSSRIKNHFVEDILHGTFSGMTWKRLATLNDVLPFLAEASPEAFLNEMNILVKNKELFDQLINDEGDIFHGGFRWLGIVHALETLAWEEEYLIRTVVLLADLALLDQQTSNMHPRPKDILEGLFWPYHPQTCANDKKIIAAAKVLINHQHQLGWDALTSAISSMSNIPHRKPRIRKSLPNDLDKASQKDTNSANKLIDEYKALLLDTAADDITLVFSLAKYLSHFKAPELFSKALAILSSQAVVDNEDKLKEPVWAELCTMRIKHRKFNEKDWAMQDDMLKEIDKVIERLKPRSLYFQNKHLFNYNIMDWYESDDYETEEQKLLTQKINAIKEIFVHHRKEGIFTFLNYINNPYMVGAVTKLADINLQNDDIIAEQDDIYDKKNAFLDGYLTQSYYSDDQNWLSSFKDVNWNNTQKASFLCHLPFISKIWHFCEEWLGNDEVLYWKDCKYRIISSDENDIDFAIQKALKYERFDIAIECLFWSHHYERPIDFNSCSQALIGLAQTTNVTELDTWQIKQLIIELQKQQRTDEQNNVLMQVEFLYLSLLDSGINDDVSPVTLDTAMATSPEFFHQILAIVYKSSKNEKCVTVDKEVVRNAFDLLFQWKKMPGVINEKLDYDAFKAWYDKVMELCQESGHTEVAQSKIGNILINTPPDVDGLWIDKRIAALLDQPENDAMRNGFNTETYNSRGFHEVDFSGKEDLDLATKYKKQASDLEDEGLLNFAETMRNLAKCYEKEAEDTQKEGERRKYQDEL